MEEFNRFSDFFRFLLDQRSIRQSELSERSGVSRQAINSYLSERHRRSPDVDHAVKIAEALELGPKTREVFMNLAGCEHLSPEARDSFLRLMAMARQVRDAIEEYDGRGDFDG